MPEKPKVLSFTEFSRRACDDVGRPMEYEAWVHMPESQQDLATGARLRVAAALERIASSLERLTLNHQHTHAALPSINEKALLDKLLRAWNKLDDRKRQRLVGAKDDNA